MHVHQIYIAFLAVPGLNLALCPKRLLMAVLSLIQCIVIRSHIRLLERVDSAVLLTHALEAKS